MTGRHEDSDDDAEQLSPRVVRNYYQTKMNGGAAATSNVNTVLLGCLLAIVGFLGVQIWIMNREMQDVHTTLTLLVEGRIRIPTAPP